MRKKEGIIVVSIQVFSLLISWGLYGVLYQLFNFETIFKKIDVHFLDNLYEYSLIFFLAFFILTSILTMKRVNKFHFFAIILLIIICSYDLYLKNYEQFYSDFVFVGVGVLLSLFHIVISTCLLRFSRKKFD